MEGIEYCKICLNADTPICKECVYTETVRGITRPTLFNGNHPDEVKYIAFDDLKTLINSRVERNQPIPIKWIVKYNSLWRDLYGWTEEIH